MWTEYEACRRAQAIEATVFVQQNIERVTKALAKIQNASVNSAGVFRRPFDIRSELGLAVSAIETLRIQLLAIDDDVAREE